jgi:hypothetical protein
MLPEELLADANAMLQTATQGLRLIAPLAGAGLYAAVGGWTVAVVDAGTFVVSAVALSLMRVEEPQPEPREHRFLVEASAGMRHIARTLPLRQMMLGAGVGDVRLVGIGLACSRSATGCSSSPRSRSSSSASRSQGSASPGRSSRS